jgi:hypothetical protein
MTAFDFAVIVLLLTLVLSTLVVRSLRRFHRQCDHINEAKKALLAAHINLARARVKHAKRKLARSGRLATNTDVGRTAIGIQSNVTQAF